jgi:hypothetical protein
MTGLEKHELVEILEGNPFQVRPLLKKWLETATVAEVPDTTRSTQQNKALWKFFQLVADELVKNGVTMRTIFAKTSSFDIPPTKDNVHDLWVHFQRAMYGTERTRDLKKHGQIERVHEVMMKNLGELFHIEYINFPTDEQKTREYPQYDGPPLV